MHRVLLAAAAALLLVACNDNSTPSTPQSDAPSRHLKLEAIEWSEVYALLDTIIPEQPYGKPIVIVSGIDFTPHHMALADFSESTVKLFRRPDYTLEHTMGGKGEGPGEFGAPFAPQFDEQGRLHVADLGRNRITVFDTLGTVVKTVRIPPFHGIIDFDLLGNGTYVVSALLVDDSLNTLFHIDSAGNEIGRFMPMARALPAGEAHNEVWNRVRHTNVALIGGESIITSVSILDSLWTLDLRTGDRRGVQASPVDYEPPTLADPERRRSWDEANEWIASATVIPAMRSSGGTVWVPFARGIYYRSESSSVLVGGNHPWKSVSGAPVIIGVEGDTVITLLPDTITYTVRLGRWVPNE